MIKIFTFVAKNISKMSVLSDNLRYLRGRRNLTQKELASELVMERGRYSKYEDAKSNPPLEVLQQISGFFRISIDLLVSIDLRRVPIDDLQNLSDATILFLDDGRGRKNKIIMQKHDRKLK